MRALALILFTLSTGCARPAGRETSDASVEASNSAEAAPDGGWLTAAKVDAWLGYHRQLMLKLDGGALDLTGRARRERAVRLDAGLSEEEVDRIEDVVAAVVTARTLSRLTGGDALREFEQATAALTPAQRAQAQKAMADLRSRAQQASGFEAEKARFGADAVEAVTAREADVTKTWDAFVDAK